MQLENFEEQVFFSTVRITIAHKAGVGGSIGTGFLHEVPLNDAKKRAVILLISNKHVFVNPEHKIALTLTKYLAGDKTKSSLGDVHTLSGEDFSLVVCPAFATYVPDKLK